MRMSSVGKITSHSLPEPAPVRNRRAGCKPAPQAGVTLIEMLVVVTIVGLLAGILGINALKQAEEAKRKLARTQISGFKTVLTAYKLDVGRYPSTESGLSALR